MAFPARIGFCQGSARQLTPSRREFLRAGLAGAAGLTLADCLRLQAATTGYRSSGREPAADAVIQIVLEGGLSHLDSFDPKPGAPIEIRGEFGAVSTRVPGMQLSGLWGQTASVADKLAIIRAVSHEEVTHEGAAHWMLTGHCAVPGFMYPSMGAVAAHEFEPRQGVPAYFALPDAATAGYGYAGAGYLGVAYGGFSITGDPQDPDFDLSALTPPPGLDVSGRRGRGLLAAIERHLRRSNRRSEDETLDRSGQQAYGLMHSQAARDAFDLAAEPDTVRAAYGREEIGPWLLAARRLVEAGAKFVTVFSRGWDMHVNLHPRMRTMVPPTDQGIAALIRDLSERGLLRRTLVLISTEFGRSPRLNSDRGRDHWSKVFSVALAGGGIRGGQIIGASTPDGAEPKDSPVRPADIAATVFTQLGIDPAKKLKPAGNHPTDVVRDGVPIKDLV